MSEIVLKYICPVSDIIFTEDFLFMRIQLSEHFTYRKLLRFTLPSVIMMVCTSIYGVVDGVFVSNFVGSDAFAAVNLIMPFLMVLGAVGFMLGTGGTPEGVVAACAIKATGGVIQGRLAPTDEAEREKALEAGHDLDRVLTTNDLVTSDNCFFAATGITDGKLLRGVRYSKNVVTTQSLVMRSSSGTVRTVEAEHRLSRLREILSHTKSPEEQ